MIGSVFGTHGGFEMSDAALDCFVRLIERNDAVTVERCLQILSRYDLARELEWLAEKKGKSVRMVVVAGGDDKNKSLDSERKYWQGLSEDRLAARVWTTQNS